MWGSSRSNDMRQAEMKKVNMRKIVLVPVCVFVLCACVGSPTPSAPEADHDMFAFDGIDGEYDFYMWRSGEEANYYEYTLINNTWGAGNIRNYKQCIFFSGEPVRFGWAWRWPYGSGAGVKAYPEVLIGRKPWSSRSTTENLPARVTDCDADISYDFTLAAEGLYNTSFDVYLTDTDNPSPSSITHELMIWVNTSSMEPYGESASARPFTVNGVRTTLYIFPALRGNGTVWDYLCFKYDDNVTKGTLRLRDYLDILLREKLIPNTAWVSSIEFGNEVIVGEGKLDMNEYKVEFVEGQAY